jgi:hypothetical protein
MGVLWSLKCTCGAEAWKEADTDPTKNRYGLDGILLSYPYMMRVCDFDENKGDIELGKGLEASEAFKNWTWIYKHLEYNQTNQCTEIYVDGDDGQFKGASLVVQTIPHW